MTEQLLSIGTTAERLSVSLPTVRRWIKAGALPAYKLGGQVRIKPADIDALLEASRIHPTSSRSAALAPRPPRPAASGGLRELLRTE